MKLTEQEAIAVLNSIFTGWQFLELLDQISDTSIYRQGLKQKVNLLMPDLQKFVDEITIFFDVDSSAMNNLMEHKRELAMKICALRPETQAGLNELLAMFFNAPELTVHRLGIKTE